MDGRFSFTYVITFAESDSLELCWFDTFLLAHFLGIIITIVRNKQILTQTNYDGRNYQM